MAAREPGKEKRSDRKPTQPKLKAIESAEVEMVTCFMSGQTVPKSEAVLVKIGPGQRMWMLPEFLSERDRRG